MTKHARKAPGLAALGAGQAGADARESGKQPRRVSRSLLQMQNQSYIIRAAAKQRHLMKMVKHNREKSGALVPVSRDWAPFWPLKRVQENLERLFEEPFGGWMAPTAEFLEAWGPAVDLYEEKDKVVVKAELPGMKKEEIEVYMSEGMLNIAGERKEETEHKQAGQYRSERHFGRFHRSLLLPAEIEPGKIEAHYKDGVLTVLCPKTQEARQKQVEIKIE